MHELFKGGIRDHIFMTIEVERTQADPLPQASFLGTQTTSPGK